MCVCVCVCVREREGERRLRRERERLNNVSCLVFSIIANRVNCILLLELSVTPATILQILEQYADVYHKIICSITGPVTLFQGLNIG